MNINEFLSIFYPVLFTFLAGFLAYVGKQLIKVAPELVAYVVAKIGLTNYQKVKAVGWDIFKAIEEDGRLGKLVNSKIDEFENRITQEFPSITKDKIEAVRQAIAGEYNRDKPVVEKAIEQVVTVAPTIKYVSTDGTELQPVKPVQ